MGKTLFLITPNPPLEPGEEFLNSELPILAGSFDKIILIHHNERYEKKEIKHIESVLVFPYLPTQTEKLKSFRYLFGREFWNELFDIIFVYKLAPTPQRIASSLGGIEMGKKFARYILANSEVADGNKIYVYSYWCNYIAIGLAFLKQLKPSITCVSRAHGYDVFFERNESGYLPLRRLIFKNLDRVYFISKVGLNYTINKARKYPSMRVSYLGCAPIPMNGKKNNNGFHIVSCSNIISLKRIDLIVDALAILSPETTVRWTHFGDGPLAETIQNYANTKLSNKLNILYEFRGYVVNEQLIDFYGKNSIDLFVNVSESEGLPFSIIEAFSAGIPALATNVGGTSEIVDPNKNGMLLNPVLTAEEVRAGIQFFADLNQITRDTYSKNAREKWHNFFQAEKNFREFVEDFL